MKIVLLFEKKLSSFICSLLQSVFMAKTRNRTGDKEKDETLRELIDKSKDIRKNIDAIMSAFRKIEKHVNDVQKSIEKKDSRQQAVNQQLEKLIRNMKQLDSSIKEKK